MKRRIGSGIWLLLFALGVTAALIPGMHHDLRAMLVFPLVFLLPGLAVGQALLPARTGWPERLLLSIALSVAIAVVGAVALNWTPLQLDAGTWTGLLTIVTVVAAAVAWARSPRPPGPRVRRSWRPAAKAIALAVLSLVMTGAALALARTPLHAEHIEGATALWLVPSAEGSETIRIGVTSAELGPVAYRLKVKQSGRITLQRRFRLAPGERWQASVVVATTAARSLFQATLYRGAQKAPYRRVSLVLPVPRAPSTTTSN